MNDKFNFPDNLNDFIDMFSFKDNKEIYTNGADLIPVFRVKEAIAYYFNGVFVKGMDMPKDCYHCRFNYDGLCHALKSSFTYIHENDISCPLSEIPTPHGRLIDADVLINDLQGIRKLFSSTGMDYIGGLISLVQNTPTVIEAEE